MLFLSTLIGRKKVAEPIRRLQMKGCHHSSVDSSAPSILPPPVQLPSTPSMLFSFIVKFVLYLSMQCEKRTKINKKEAGFGPIKKRLQMMMAWIILKIFSKRSRGPGLKKWFMITWGWGWSEIMCRNLILLPKSDIKNQWLDFSSINQRTHCVESKNTFLSMAGYQDYKI